MSQAPQQVAFLFSEGLSCPFFACAVCGERLEQPGKQMIAWDMNKEKERLRGHLQTDLPLYPVHKALDGRTCLAVLEHQIEEVDDGRMGTTELDDFLGQLLHNSGYEVPSEAQPRDSWFFHFKPRKRASP